MTRDEILASVGLVLAAFGAGLVVGRLVDPVAGAGVFAAVLGIGLAVYALFLSPTPPEQAPAQDRPEVS